MTRSRRDCNVILRDAETGIPVAEFHRMKSKTRDDLLAALIVFCAHHHSGQWSRGYRLMCRAQMAWRRRNRREFPFDYYERSIEMCDDDRVTKLYKRLVRDHGENV